MDTLLTLIRQYLSVESRLNAAFTELHPERYNQLLAKLRSYYRHPDLRPLYAPREGDWTGPRAKRYANFNPPPMTRRITKLSRYLVGEDEVWVSYLTSLLPIDSPTVDLHRGLFWRAGGDHGFGIVASHAWPLGDQTVKRWSFVAGDPKLHPKHLHEPTEVLRLLAPTHEPAALADHQKEK
jgi:hypothetical protein